MGAGSEHTAGFALFYRGFGHRPIREICEVLQASTMKQRYQYALRRQAVSQEARDFAGAFPALQDARHSADYDPAVEFDLPLVSYFIDEAEVAIDAFDRIPPQERADILALMLVGARS